MFVRLVGFALMVSCPFGAFAADASYAPLQNYKKSFSYLGDRESLIVLGSGVAALAGARVLDEEAQEYFHNRDRLGGLEELGNEVLGTGVPGLLIGFTFWTVGATGDNAKAEHAGQAQIEAIVGTFVATSAVKWSARRERPDGSDNYSFPSGHTSTVFASASSLTRFYGWRAGVPAYSLAVLTALSRVSENRHWLSDTVGGALIGELVGQAVARAHLGAAESAVTVLPMPPVDDDADRRGLLVRWEY